MESQVNPSNTLSMVISNYPVTFTKQVDGSITLEVTGDFGIEFSLLITNIEVKQLTQFINS